LPQILATANMARLARWLRAGCESERRAFPQ
jgi:hypothetical protein